MEEVIKLLQEYGGWAMTAFLAFSLNRLHSEYQEIIKNKDDHIKKIYEDHHKEITAVIRECTGVLTTVNESLNRFKKEEGK